MQFSKELADFCSRVRAAPVQVTLRELLDLFMPQEGDDPKLLGRLKLLQPAIDFLVLDVIPSIDDGDFDSKRLVVQRQIADATESELRTEISRDEDGTLEKKSTFTCCMKTLRAKSGLEPKQYRKDVVEDSLLCAIAGLMNASGGILLVGVEDKGNVCGLEPDFMALGLDEPDVDNWLLKVRAKVDTSFFQGRMINDHVDFKFFTLEGKTIARAVVRPRQKLALLKNLVKQDQYQIIQRQGNRTVSIELTDAEEFFENRYKLRQHQAS